MTNNDVYAIISKANKKQNWVRECPIDQLTKTDVASIIRRATSGQPILGDPNRVFDGSERSEGYNPQSEFSWDLDDVTDVMDAYKADSIEALQDKLKDQITSNAGTQPDSNEGTQPDSNAGTQPDPT